MSSEKHQPITQLLAAVGDGNGDATEQLWQLVYGELHRIAKHQVNREYKIGHLCPTELIHEAFFKLFPNGDNHFANRRHFFAAAAEAMRRIRIDDARKRGRAKRQGGAPAARVAQEPMMFDQNVEEVLAVGDALSTLEQFDPEKAEVIKLRYFAGLTVNETADAMGVCPRKVNTQWRLARAWLHRVLADGDTTVHT